MLLAKFFFLGCFLGNIMQIVRSACEDHTDNCNRYKNQCHVIRDLCQKTCDVCVEDQDLVIWSTTALACLKGMNDKILKTPSFEDCKEACLDETGFRCESVDYFPPWQECQLSTSRSTSDAYKEPCYGGFHGNLFAERIPDYELMLWSKTALACLKGKNDKMLKTPTFKDCKEKCMEETTFRCESVDYFPPDHECQLSKTRSTSDAYMEPCYSPWHGNLFAERIHDPELMLWSKTALACLKGKNDKILKTPTLEDCKEKCLEETTFICESVDYFPPDHECQLSETRSTSDAYMEPCYSPWHGNLFAQRIHETPIKQDPELMLWTKTALACLKGKNDKILKTPTFEDCKEKCLKETTFRCESVDYFPPDQECQLSKTRSTSDAYMEPCYSPWHGNLFAERIHVAE